MKLVPLTKGQFAKVDDEDYEWVTQWKWQAWWHETSRAYYAARMETIASGTKTRRHRRPVHLHRELLGLGDGTTDLRRADHINGDKLDNQRRNLRVATSSQNCANRGLQRHNTTGYKGVSPGKDGNRWRASISMNGKRKYLGTFRSPREAAAAYNQAARGLHGEFAYLNPL